MDTTGTFPAVTGHCFNASHTSAKALGGFPAAESGQELVWISVLSGLDSGSLWRFWSPWFSKGAAGSTRLRSGWTPLTWALTLILLYEFFSYSRGDQAFSPTWNCCCRSWKQSCNSSSCCGQLGWVYLTTQSFPGTPVSWVVEEQGFPSSQATFLPLVCPEACRVCGPGPPCSWQGCWRLLAGAERILVGVTKSVPGCYEIIGNLGFIFFTLW